MGGQADPAGSLADVSLRSPSGSLAEPPPTLLAVIPPGGYASWAPFS